ncbi:putative diacylglycerol acyltransferase [Trypanosoma theileri]|uniref:Putative diacylglycerol acyltransferase n=1 Tax=Trypanosoma theileri TaxID=67003 RepID=A0A1X0P5P6_9TRYP|nr:putative diacylglycerol acyltransferase [Trypanosoma theileri]ORC91750.1 putative diacylglycerol acyltransferase [Trypanosoma theileri]
MQTATKPEAQQTNVNPGNDRHHAHKKTRADKLSTRRTAVLMRNPMSITLMVLWAIACEGALMLNILADVFQSQAPVFPLVPTIITSIGLNTLCAFLTSIMGRLTLRNFRMYQPFLGGQAFVVMQGFGYGILVISSVLLFVYVEYLDSASPVFRYGTLTVLGCFSAIADITLMVSLLFFVTKRHKRKNNERLVSEESKSDASVWWRDLSAPPNAEIGIVVLFCIAILTSSSFAEYYPGMRRISSIVGAFFLILGMITIHVGIGYWYTPGYRLFMPNAGGLKMSIMQAFGWFLACASLQLDMVLYEAGASSSSSWHILCGLCSVISMSTLLIFVRLHRFPTSTQNELSILAEYGPLVLTVASIIHAGVVWGLALLLSSERYDLEPRLRQGLIMCQTLSSLLTFTLPPCTHLLGRIAFGKKYGVWMPFKGPLEFVVLQSAGWTCFGTAIFFATLQITESLHFRFIIIQSSLTALSQGFIHASLHLFYEGHKGDGKQWSVSSRSGSICSEEIAHPTGYDEEEDSLREEGRSLVTSVLNGEMLTAILLCTIGLLLRVITDVAVVSGNEFEEIIYIPTDSLLKVSTFLFFLVVPIAHISMRERISIWQPFVGCGGYVAMQSIGWSVYAVNILVALANSFLGKRKGLLLPIMEDQYVFLEYTMEGLFATIPLICIIMGAFFETQEQNCKKSFQERSRQEVLELYRVLQRAIPDEEDLRHAESLLKAIAGPRWMDPPANDGVRLIHEDEETAQTRQEAATHIVTILALAGILAFASGAFLTERQPVFTLVFGLAGVTVTTISCFSVHYVYGTFLHRASGRYSFFMPFSGGSTFVTLQAIGWGFYTASSLLIAVCCVEGRGSAVMYTAACVFSVSAQYCILNSIPRFDPTPRPTSVLERNAEGIVAVLALIASFGFASVCDLHVQGRISGGASSLLPITLTAVSTCFAVPLGLVSLKRNANMYNFSPFSILDNSVNLDDSDADVDSTEPSLAQTGRSPIPSEYLSPLPSPSLGATLLQRQTSDYSSEVSSMGSPQTSSFFSNELGQTVRRGYNGHIRERVYLSCLSIAVFFAILVTALVPFAFGYIAYGYAYSGFAAIKAASTSLQLLLFGFAIAVLVPMFAPSEARRKQKTLQRRLYAAFCSFVIYSIPTMVVVGSLSLPLIFDTMGAWTFASTMVVMSCISTLPHVHLISTLTNVCALGYFLHYHIYACLLSGTSPFSLWKFIADTFATSFWLFYFNRFVGRPHLTGRLRNATARDFLYRWVFSGVAEYFDLRVIADKDDGDENDNNNNDKNKVGFRHVDMNDPTHQYLFSFHPHGIFPGTAMWAPITRQWDTTVGWNPKTYVTTHGADVIFSVPLMRDFALAVGGMGVSRRGIENSLQAGNSPIIVTGGQAEMVLSRMSDTEMHLVTHHSGFVRIALRHNVPLVPLLCFAEHNVLGNIRLPRLQRYAVRRVGFPFPTIPYGRWYLPLPTNRPLTLVIGRPVYPEDGAVDAENPEDVARFQQRYFAELERIFFKYRAIAGYPNMSLVLHNHEEVQYLTKPTEKPLVGVNPTKREILRSEETKEIQEGYHADQEKQNTVNDVKTGGSVEQTETNKRLNRIEI